MEENPRKTTYNGHEEDRRSENTSSGIRFNPERQRQPNSETQPAAKIIKVGSQSGMAVVRPEESMVIPQGIRSRNLSRDRDPIRVPLPTPFSTSNATTENHQTTSTFRKLHSKIPLEGNDESFVKGKIGRTSFRK